MLGALSMHLVDRCDGWAFREESAIEGQVLKIWAGFDLC
jgi:hypothetical protein